MQERSFLLAFGSVAAWPALGLYDPKPITMLEAASGTWAGTLSYRDNQPPHRMVTLKTMMSAALTAPDELALYYVFDDGPGKTVHSYETMKFDLAAAHVIWTSGAGKPSRNEYQISAASVQDGRTTLAFEKTHDARTEKYGFTLTPTTWLLSKHEAQAGQQVLLRNQYELARQPA